VGSLRASAVERLDKLEDAHAVTLGQAGRRLEWPPMERVAGNAEATSLAGGHRLVLYFSEHSCSACLDRESLFLTSLAAATGGDGLAVVAHADSVRYVLNYVRQNGIVDIPVFFDADHAFGPANGVEETPVLFLVDGDGRVVTAHFPLLDRPSWSEPFHSAAQRLLGLPGG